MGDAMVGKEAHKIKQIEEVTCRLANAIGNVSGRANTINDFFFGIGEDRPVESNKEAEISSGWFETHKRVLLSLEVRVERIIGTLSSLCEVADKK